MKTSRRIATVILGLLVSAVAFADFPQTFPNSRKYRDSGAKPATGRSGSAAIEARALLGKDGTTDIEISTGHLDSAGAPGNIDKAQLKFRNGSSTATRNHNNLNEGGYVVLHYEGLSPLDSIQIQTNVSGIDPKRTDVVTVETEVKRRPDLTVAALLAPATTRPGEPVTIVATVHELNGDLGARADCVLFANGVQIDQSPNIWVDAGGTVSCMFSRSFTTIGIVNLRVSLLNVAPGDWDTSNNSLTGQIEVLNPSTPFRFYSATLNETNSLTIQEFWTATRYEKKEWRSWSNATAFTGEVGLMNLDVMTASIHYQTDGRVIADFTFDARTNLPGRLIGGLPCRVTRIADYFIQVCERRVGGVRTGSSVMANRNAGSVTFHSEGFDKNMVGQNGEPYFTWNQTDPPVLTGSQIRTGSTATMQILVEDGQERFEAALQFLLGPAARQEFNFFTPTQCANNPYASSTCTRFYFLSEGIRGTASGRN